MRKVVSELCKGFKEILLVAILLSVGVFVFANWGVHLFGMRFASCNDQTIKDRYLNDIYKTMVMIIESQNERFEANIIEFITTERSEVI